MKQTVTFTIGSQTIELETGRIAKQADGSVLVTSGNNVVLVTVVSSKKETDLDFFPLTIEYAEKFYASGKIPGGFFKREGRPTTEATLNARLIDRPLRPSFPEGYRKDTQIVATIMSFDGTFPVEILASIGASAATHISDIPFNGPTAAIMLGRVNGEFIVNPSPTQLEASDLEIIVAGTRNGILMVEGEAKLVTEDVVLAALKYGHAAMKPIFDAQDELRAKVGNVAKREFTPFQVDENFRAKVTEFAGPRISEALSMRQKADRYNSYSDTKAACDEKFIKPIEDAK